MIHKIQSKRAPLVPVPSTETQIFTSGLVCDKSNFLLLRDSTDKTYHIPGGPARPKDLLGNCVLSYTNQQTGYLNLKILSELGSQVINKGETRESAVQNVFGFLIHLQVERKPDYVIVRRCRSSQLEEGNKPKFKAVWVPQLKALPLLSYKVDREFVRRALLEIYRIFY